MRLVQKCPLRSVGGGERTFTTSRLPACSSKQRGSCSIDGTPSASDAAIHSQEEWCGRSPQRTIGYSQRKKLSTARRCASSSAETNEWSDRTRRAENSPLSAAFREKRVLGTLARKEPDGCFEQLESRRGCGPQASCNRSELVGGGRRRDCLRFERTVALRARGLRH